MLLAIDMGNTQIVFGVFDQARLIADWRLKTRLDRTSDEYGIDCLNLMKIHNLQMEKIDGLIISSVVPNLDSVIEAMCQRYFNASPLFVESHPPSVHWDNRFRPEIRDDGAWLESHPLVAGSGS